MVHILMTVPLSHIKYNDDAFIAHIFPHVFVEHNTMPLKHNNKQTNGPSEGNVNNNNNKNKNKQGSKRGNKRLPVLPEVLRIQLSAAEKLVHEYYALREASRAFKPSPEQIEALKDYMAKGYVLVNRALEGRNDNLDWRSLTDLCSVPHIHAKHMSVKGLVELVKQADDSILRNIKHLDAVLAAAPKTTAASTLVFRGVTDEFAETVMRLTPGESITTHGFLSTSLDPGVSRKFFQFNDKGCMMIIAVPRGTPYVIVDHVVADDSLWELEVLMARGATLTVRWTQDIPDFSVLRLIKKRPPPPPLDDGPHGHDKTHDLDKTHDARAKSTVRGSIRVVCLDLVVAQHPTIPESAFPPSTGLRIIIEPWQVAYED